MDAGYHLILSNGITAVPQGYIEATQRYKKTPSQCGIKAGIEIPRWIALL